MGTFSLTQSLANRKKVTAAQQKTITDIYSNMAKQVAQKAEKLKGTTASGALQSVELSRLSRELQALAKGAGEQVQTTIMEGMRLTADGVVADALAFNEAINFSINGAFSGVSKRAVESVATGSLYPGKWSLSNAIWSDVKAMQGDISRVVAEGIAANKSTFDIAKDLEQYVDPKAKKPWDWGKVYPGTRTKIDYAAQRLARTMVAHAYQTSLVTVVDKNPFVEGIKWLSGHSDRTCELCNERDGKVFPKNNLPLDHPNGLCTFVAEVPKDMRKVADELADWAKGGKNPGIDKWVKSMGGTPAKVQFNSNQKEWLAPLGYAPGKMPKDFKEFAEQLSYSQQDKLLTLAGADWGHPHPYQQMEKWYQKNLMTAATTTVKEKAPKVRKVKGSGVTRTHIEQLRSTQGEEHKELLIQHSEKWWGSIRQVERSAVVKYTGSSYSEMNRVLRRGDTLDPKDELHKAIKRCEYALKSSTIPVDTVVVRGSTTEGLFGMLGVETDEYYLNWAKANRDKIIGTVAKDDGFLSTSIASGFTSRNVRYSIYAPEGTKGAYVAPYSHFKTEEEVILPPGTKMRVLDLEIMDDNDTLHIFMEVLK